MLGPCVRPGLVRHRRHPCMHGTRETYDWLNGELVAVTNQDSDMAFGAWTMTIDGPEPYENLDQLECERIEP